MIDHWKDQIRTPKFGIKGGQRLGASIEEMRLLDWSRVIETNLTDTFLCAQAVGKVMLGNRRGKIIHLQARSRVKLITAPLLAW
jgi:NAD(P)-dependent dehydrogenase (short-subunit alcohol dehydrogenase family)